MTLFDAIIGILAVVGAIHLAGKVYDRVRARRTQPAAPPANKVILLYFDETGALTPITEYGAAVDVYSVNDSNEHRVCRHTLKADRDEINAILVGDKWQRTPVTVTDRRKSLRLVP